MPMPAPYITKSFSLGELVATRGALAALERAGQPPLLFILRHIRGDWGEVGPEDWQANDEAVVHGDRLLSAYRTSLDERIWVITESTRECTTILLPDDY